MGVRQSTYHYNCNRFFKVILWTLVTCVYVKVGLFFVTYWDERGGLLVSGEVYHMFRELRHFVKGVVYGQGHVVIFVGLTIVQGVTLGKVFQGTNYKVVRGLVFCSRRQVNRRRKTIPVGVNKAIVFFNLIVLNWTYKVKVARFNRGRVRVNVVYKNMTFRAIVVGRWTFAINGVLTIGLGVECVLFGSMGQEVKNFGVVCCATRLKNMEFMVLFLVIVTFGNGNYVYTRLNGERGTRGGRTGYLYHLFTFSYERYGGRYNVGRGYNSVGVDRGATYGFTIWVGGRRRGTSGARYFGRNKFVGLIFLGLDGYPQNGRGRGRYGYRDPTRDV